MTQASLPDFFRNLVSKEKFRGSRISASKLSSQSPHLESPLQNGSCSAGDQLSGGINPDLLRSLRRPLDGNLKELRSFLI